MSQTARTGYPSTPLSALYPVLAVDDPATTAAQFRRLFGFETVFAEDWYVHLKGPKEQLQLGFVRVDHESVPSQDQHAVRGTFVTIDCDDVAALWEALREELDVIVPMVDESWGQRHFIARLSGGVLVDVVQMLSPA